MRPLIHFTSLALAVVLLAGTLSARSNPVIVWFAPAPGSLDMLRLFEAGDEWAAARARVSVFKFYAQHLLQPAAPIVGPNTYQALRAADAFRTLTRVWHKRIAIEVGAVKEQYCTQDASGMDAALRDTLNAVAAVRAADGEVSALAMDVPFLAGQSAACGGPGPGPTLARLERYMTTIRLFDGSLRVGLIEPYPYFPAATIAGFLRQMTLHGIRPAFFHLDVDLNAIKPAADTFAQDVPWLAAQCADMRIPFGIIFWGHNGDSDALYVEDAMRLVRRTNDAFPDQLPQHVIFQSWAVSRTGRVMTPTNLPETGDNTHTALIDGALGLLSRPAGDRPSDSARPGR